MQIGASDLIIGLMMVVFGVVGLFLGAGAVDDEMYIFGVSLFVFACVFILGLIRAHYNRLDAVRAVARAEGSPHV